MALTKVTGQGLETLSDGVTITTADNTDQLTLTSTDADANSGPNLRLYRNSANPADNDFLGTIDFEGRNDNSQNFVAARIFTFTPDVSDGSEDAQLQLSMMKGGSSHIALEIKPDEFVINNGSKDIDFRVESNGNANMLFVDGGNDKIGIGTNAQSDVVHLKGGSDNRSKGAPIIRLQKKRGGTGNEGQTIGGISFYVNDDGVNSGSSYERAKIIAESQNSSSGTRLEFWTGNSNADIAERMRIIADGNVGIGTTNVTEKLTVDGSFNATASIKSLGVYNNTTGTGANVVVDSAGGFARSTSSLRYKNTINDTTHGLTELLKLRPVTYKGNNDGDTVFGGLIAEEVHDAGLTEFVTYNDKKEPDALAYGNMVSLCIKAIQELSKKNDALETKNDALEARIKTLEDA